MKKRITTTLGLCVTLSCHAYIKQPEDYLLVEGEPKHIVESPLKSYLRYSCDMADVVKYDSEFFVPNYTYVERFWEIRDGKLFLLRITDGGNKTYPLSELFPDKKDKNPVWASWYSGSIWYSFGEMMGPPRDFAVFEKEMVFHIAKGQVQNKYLINNNKRSVAYAEAYLKSKILGPNITDLDNSMLGMTHALRELFSSWNNRHASYSYSYPFSIKVVIDADLDNFKMKSSYKKLSCFDFLNTITEETETTLDVRFYDGDVIYKIK